MERYAFNISKRLTVEIGDMTMMSQMISEDRHLSTSNASTDIAKTIIVSQSLMLVIGERFTSLSGEPKYAFLRFSIGYHQSTTARCGYHLVSVKRENPIGAEGTKATAVKRGAETLGRIFYDRDIIPVGDLKDSVYMVRHTVESHRDDSLWFSTRARYSILYDIGEKVGVHIPRIPFRIHKHRIGSQISHRIGRSTEGERLDYHFVGRLHTTSDKSQMDGRCAGSECHHLLIGSHILFQIFLECIHIGAQRDHPIRFERLFHVTLLCSIRRHVGKTKIYTIFGHRLLYF